MNQPRHFRSGVLSRGGLRIILTFRWLAAYRLVVENHSTAEDSGQHIQEPIRRTVNVMAVPLHVPVFGDQFFVQWPLSYVAQHAATDDDQTGAQFVTKVLVGSVWNNACENRLE